MIPPFSSAIKALNILQAFTEDRAEPGVTQISQLVKSLKSSAPQILTALMAESFVKKNPLSPCG